MLHLHSSNRLEYLAETLVAHLRHQPAAHPLTPVSIAVPHPGVQHWLSLYLAEADGIAMNYDFPLASRFMWRQVRRLCADLTDGERWTREVMAWSLHDLMGRPEWASDPVFEVPRRYIERTRSAGGRYQLAAEIADLFEQYLMYRPDMLRKWQAGEDPNDWQACLWRALAGGETTPVDQLHAALEAARGRPAGMSADTLRLFALHMLPPVWLELLDALAQTQDVHVYVLNPSEAWWGDLRSRRQQLGEAARALRLGQPVTPPDTETLSLQEGHPLLAQLGRQGQAWLNSLAERDTGSGQQVWVEPQASHTLAALQGSLLTLEPERARTGQMDGSFQIVSAHSPLREVQALHDWLLARFEADPTLKPRDVVVMTPEIERYAPVVEAVFDLTGSTQDTRLPATLSDRRAADADPLIRAFLALLSLPESRLERGWVLDQMRLPAARSRWGWGEDALQRIEQWMDQAAIYRGLDAEHLRSQGLPPRDQFTWLQGLRRLLLGAVMGDAPVVLEGAQLVTVPDVPDAEALSLAGKVMQFIDHLQAARRALCQERTAEAWSVLLLETLQDLYAETPDTGASWQQIRDALRAWVQAVQRAGVSAPLPLAVVRAALRRSLGDHQVQGGYLAGRVTFCSLVPLRSVPFRIVCLLGLSADSFPRNRPPLPFDKMAEAPRWGDRSRRDDDLYLFLESILSARDGLYLSYVGRSIRDDSVCEPAWPLKTLMDVVGIERPVQLPLQPFDPAHYTPGAPLQSHDARWLKVAQHLSGIAEGEPPGEPESTPLQVRLPEVLTLDFIVKLLDDPVGQFARQVLGLKLDEVERDPEAEPFVLGGLEGWQIRDRWLRESLKAPDRLPELRKQVMYGGLLPASPDPEALLDTEIRVAEDMAQALRTAAGGHAPQWTERQVMLDNGHTLQVGFWKADKEIFLASPSRLKGKHRVQARLLARILKAAGEDDLANAGIRVLGRAGDKVDEYSCPPVNLSGPQALELLNRLVDLLHVFWSAPVPLPLDAWFNEQKRDGLKALDVPATWEKWWMASEGWSDNSRPNGEKMPYALFWSVRPDWQDDWAQVLASLWTLFSEGDSQ
ncbi:exodeoxyribonuclease V subunit gamma [Hahella sp. SMD15-11]|uniref:RecBCD enzyme subunit RecC n=1 Tax=Thermohahella caldifontis TaxID=3142973 RepID=A0AB39USQ2_9GAMM